MMTLSVQVALKCLPSSWSMVSPLPLSTKPLNTSFPFPVSLLSIQLQHRTRIGVYCSSPSMSEISAFNRPSPWSTVHDHVSYSTFPFYTCPFNSSLPTIQGPKQIVFSKWSSDSLALPITFGIHNLVPSTVEKSNADRSTTLQKVCVQFRGSTLGFPLPFILILCHNDA